MERSIDELLNNEQPAPETDTQAQPEPQAAPEAISEPQPRGPDGKFATKQTGVDQPQEIAAEPVPPTEQTQLPRDVYEPLRAVRDENRELKRQIDAIQRQMYAQPAPQPPQPPVDFWDDPQAFMDTRMNQLGQTLLQQWEQRETAKRLDQSEQTARSKYTDYDDAFGAFEQAVQANPRLAVELAQAADPGEFAYRKGKAALTLSSVGSLEDYEAQLRAKWEAEVKGAFQPNRPSLPSTTAADTSVGARTGPAWSGPKSIDEILKA